MFYSYYEYVKTEVYQNMNLITWFQNKSKEEKCSYEVENMSVTHLSENCF